MAEDVQPLLAAKRDSRLLKEVESLTVSLTKASEDLRRLHFELFIGECRENLFMSLLRVHSSVMTPENTELIQKSIHTLILTMKNIESISSYKMGFTGDEVATRNIKLLIKSLSRLL